MNQTTQILIIDRVVVRRSRLADLALSAGHHAEVYDDADDFITQAPSEGIVVVVDDPAGQPIGALTEAMKRSGLWLPVIAMAEYPEPSRIVRAIKAGASDYLAFPKQTVALHEFIAGVLHEVEIHRTQRSRCVSAHQRVESLSARQREVLDWLAKGKNNNEIALSLALSRRTVEFHRLKMMGKLGASHVVDAVRLLIDATELETG